MFDCYYCVFSWDWKRISINYCPNLTREVLSQGEFIKTASTIWSMGWLLGTKRHSREKNPTNCFCKMRRLSNGWILRISIPLVLAQIIQLFKLWTENSMITQWSCCVLCAEFSGGRAVKWCDIAFRNCSRLSAVSFRRQLGGASTSNSNVER